MDRRDIWKVCDKVFGAAVVVALLAVVLGASCAYARWVYGDWKCGMPGVKCRKVTR